MRPPFARPLGILATVTAAAGLALAATLGTAPWRTTVLGHAVEFADPAWFLGALTVPWLAWVVARSRTGSTAGKRALTFCLRTLVLLCLLAALSRPNVVLTNHDRSVVILIDRSASIDAAQRAELDTFANTVRERAGDVHVRVLEFASAVEPPGPTDTTDLEGATVTALGFLPAGGERRIVLATDGRGTRGSLLRAAERLQTRGVELDAMLPSARPSDDVAVIGLGAPERIELGARFPVDVEVHADGETAAEVALYENGALPDVRHVKSVVLKPGTNRVSFETVSYAPGDLTLEARVAPKGHDRLPGNDRFARVVRIVGKPRVLYVATAPGEERGSVRALEAGGFDVEVRSPDGLPRDTASLRAFDAVLLSNVPRARVRDDQQRPLVAYVRDTGGTLLMAGGAESFGPGGWEGSPVADILPVTLEGERRKDRPSLALALVIDRSGSMTGQKIELAKEAARRTAELLNPDDYIGVVGFDSAPTVIVRMQSARNRLRMDSDIGRVAARGGTNIFPALDLAYRELQLSRAIKKHVILLTDGQSPDRGLRDLAQVMNADGITLTTVGLGGDIQRALLTDLAEMGGGRAYFTDDANRIPRIFVDETESLTRSNLVEEYVGVRVAGPVPFLRGIAPNAMPLLRGYVATRGKPPPAQVLLASDLGEPIFARERVGLGWSLAWTTDTGARWAAPWLAWPAFPKFWSQLLRAHLSRETDDALMVGANVVGDEAAVRVDVSDASGEFTAGLTGFVTATSGDAPAITAQLSERAPGRYEAKLPLANAGFYDLRATLGDGTRATRTGHATFAHPFPTEFTPDDGNAAERLRPALVRTGGRILQSPGEALAATGQPTEAPEPISRWFLWAALALFLADVLARRLAWRRREKPGDLRGLANAAGP